MSTVIIGGGDEARARIHALETASLSMTSAQRDAAELLLKDFNSAAQALQAQIS